MSLFATGDFLLHSGERSSFKIDCDHLTSADWMALSLIIAERVGRFRGVYGVPTGGAVLAVCLQTAATNDRADPLLIVDDVYTTGQSMRDAYAWATDGRQHIIGYVVFARRPVKEPWITALFTMGGG